MIPLHGAGGGRVANRPALCYAAPDRAMAKSSDEIKELQRGITGLHRPAGTGLPLGGRAYLVQLEAVGDPDALLALLMRETVQEAEAIEGLLRSCRLAGAVRWIDG